MFEMIDKIPFGKYKGKTLEKIIEKDPHYITWCVNNVDGFYLTKESERWLRLYSKLIKPYDPYDPYDYCDADEFDIY